LFIRQALRVNHPVTRTFFLSSRFRATILLHKIFYQLLVRSNYMDMRARKFLLLPELAVLDIVDMAILVTITCNDAFETTTETLFAHIALTQL